MELYEILKKLNINYDIVEHEALFTVEDAKKVSFTIDGIGCKNLFLTDKCNNYYLVVLQEDKKANINEIRKIVSAKKLCFASSDELNNILKLEKGSVTPLGVINDVDNRVIVILDKDLIGNKILCHPNVNTKTLSLEYDDLLKFLDYLNHKYIIL